uniref:Secreted protein n=1 Tax=Bactrocera dorsalis TaxID=27457 RepID=A0A034UZX1_BACDO
MIMIRIEKVRVMWTLVTAIQAVVRAAAAAARNCLALSHNKNKQQVHCLAMCFRFTNKRICNVIMRHFACHQLFMNMYFAIVIIYSSLCPYYSESHCGHEGVVF